MGRAELHLFINKWYNPFFDSFFTMITHLGSGWIALFVSVILLFVRINWAFAIGAAGVLSGLTVQLFKRYIFDDVLRPSAVLSGQLHFPAGVDVHTTMSFPSGHSATIFCLGICFSMILGSKRYSVVLFCISALVAFSRIYLSQHFSGDVAVGSFVGMVGGWAVCRFFDRLKSPWLNKGLMGK